MMPTKQTGDAYARSVARRHRRLVVRRLFRGIRDIPRHNFDKLKKISDFVAIISRASFVLIGIKVFSDKYLEGYNGIHTTNPAANYLDARLSAFRFSISNFDISRSVSRLVSLDSILSYSLAADLLCAIFIYMNVRIFIMACQLSLKYLHILYAVLSFISATPVVRIVLFRRIGRIGKASRYMPYGRTATRIAMVVLVVMKIIFSIGIAATVMLFIKEVYIGVLAVTLEALNALGGSKT